MYIKGCPIEQGTLSEILSAEEVGHIVDYIVDKLAVFFKLQTQSGGQITLHNSYILISCLMQKFSLEIARIVKKSDPKFSPSSGKKNYRIVESTRDFILSLGLDNPFLSYEWLLVAKANSNSLGNSGKKKRRYITIDQNIGPRSFLRKSNLWEDRKLNQVDVLHRDISQILTGFESPLFERYEKDRRISKTSDHNEDISFIVDLTKLYSSVAKNSDTKEDTETSFT